MAPTQSWQRARSCSVEAWASARVRRSLLPDDLRSRMSFIHHRTYSNAHPEYGKVQGLLGSAKAADGNGQEMIASLFAQENAGALHTIQSEPVPLGSELISYQSRPLANLKPVDLKSLFATPQDFGGQAAEATRYRARHAVRRSESKWHSLPACVSRSLRARS